MGEIVEWKKCRLESNKPRTVTFVSAVFHHAGATNSYAWSLTVENGDYLSPVEQVKKEGGIWMKNDQGEDIAFMPWPPAMMLIS